jgi:hypothetical protein
VLLALEGLTNHKISNNKSRKTERSTSGAEVLLP